MSIINNINTHLIDLYLTTSDVYCVEETLNDLVKNTSHENYLELVNYMLTSEHCSERDFTIYLLEIVTPQYKNLIPLITDKILTFQDREAINDLQTALNALT